MPTPYIYISLTMGCILVNQTYMHFENQVNSKCMRGICNLALSDHFFKYNQKVYEYLKDNFRNLYPPFVLIKLLKILNTQYQRVAE